ncbi:helicase-exonuclease AddAB subunit AddA [Halobacillus sp. Marseille-Q1614]|uniref:helicase-exonuclease AddAB subunit AddA n=1 Tax=Halobacillus sp. Marseille-Q1614 TaxID=2709134 RepID=UPI001570B99E|nr:helicase-exonuclease AddAB subunit AddA [Halobacillus sp. Marseille-Q1614]
MVSWTKEQEKAIYTEGTNVLVAAAAGSGKTAVLVERIIQKLLNKDNPSDIDSLLVVTFTNAAAQEMRNRVGAALAKALEKNPESRHLKKQLSLLQNASISTLHSFCMDVVRRYAYLLDLDPGFRIADDVEADLIRQEVLEDLFEDWYGKEGEEQRRFFDMVDRFSSDRNDLDVEQLILGLYTFAMQNPWPYKWLDEMAAMYKNAEGDETNISWLQLLKREVDSQLMSMESEIHQFIALTREADGPSSYGETAEADLEMVQQAKGALAVSWEELQAYISTSKFAALSRKKMECDEAKKERAKKIRDRYKKRWMNMKEEWFQRRLDSYLSDMHALYPVMEQLTAVVKDFHERYQELKREKAVVDFSDLEHYCLQILLDESSTKENPVPSSVARGFHEQFSEVLIDEYQDTNLVQETLLRLLTDAPEAGRLFMVGDVKQSIYRFRHAEPALFLNKYRTYGKDEQQGERIDLARNFRSRKQVLDAANYVFRQVLDEEVGEMNYEPEAELIYSNLMYDEAPSEEAQTELLIIDREGKEESTPSDEEGFEDLEKAQLEARAYAEKIRTWLGYGEEPPLEIIDKEKGVRRPVQFRDIVILMRSMTWASTIVDELKQQGIPVYAELSTEYFEAIEVKIMLNLLKVIDNPRQDIPLASVLKSPIVDLNEDELMQLRLEDQRVTYYESMKKAIGPSPLGQKIKQFTDKLDDFRERARQGALSELIWQIYRATGYYDFVGGMPGGRQRQANLRALYDRARSYESTSFRGLFRFLRFIERMEERGDDLGAARALGEQEDVVRIMTIHKSKGLEFPVVILGAMDKSFNMMDLRDRYLLHKDYGFGSRYIDPKKRLMFPTLAYHAIKRVKLRELLAEEMRVLYVALTRAKEKLVMVGNVASFEKKREKWLSYVEESNWVLPPHDRLEAKSYLDWVGPALIRHQDTANLRGEGVEVKTAGEIQYDASQWEVQLSHGSDYSHIEEIEKLRDEKLQEQIAKWDGEEREQSPLVERLNYKYPHEQAAHARAKQTVTEIKRQRESIDEYSSDQLLVPYRAPLVKRPRFMQENQGLSAGEIGTAMHTVMQHIPLNEAKSAAEVEEFVEHLFSKDILRREEADEINHEAIASFFTTSIGERILEAEEVHREVPFSLTLPAHKVYNDWEGATDEKVFIQGVIDAVIPYGEGWLILDYKTDSVPEGEGAAEKMKDRYRTQLHLYRTALEKIWNRPVERSYLFFFDGPHVVEVGDHER